jgi:hypothetical protein
LYRKFRNADKGDLGEAHNVAIPDAHYLNGTPLAEYTKPKAPVALGRHAPHKLERLPEEGVEDVFSRKQEVATPSVESHDSFIEISK